MEKSLSLAFALLAARLKKLSPEELYDFGRQGGALSGISWRDILVSFGLLNQTEAGRLASIASELLRVCGGEIREVATLLDMHAHLALLEGKEAPAAGLRAEHLEEQAEFRTIPMRGPLSAGEGDITARLISEAKGRYRHISQQGSGGMGRVLLVHDNSVGRDVAMKELMTDPSGETSVPETPLRETTRLATRFLQEAVVTARLEHPNIVPVYELGRRENGLLFYTMRLVKGSTLSEVINQSHGLVDRLKLLSNFRDLCHAIAYAHSRGVIHRDIKPSNVMIGMFGETVVLDWGIAKVRDQDDIYDSAIRDLPTNIVEDAKAWQETEYGTAVGTPQYMSPEQAEGRVDEITERSDVYSLGVVLYEILAGVTPFQAHSLNDLLQRVSRGNYADLDTVAPNAPPELISVCKKAMKRKASERYQSVLALAEDIDRWQSGLLVQAYEYRFIELATRYYRRQKTLVHVVGAAALVLALGLGLSYWRVLVARDREAQQRVIAEQQTYDAQMLLAQQHIDTLNFGAARKLLDGAQPELRGWEWGWLAAQCAQDAATLTCSGGYIWEARYSNDGNKIVSVSTNGSIELFDVETHERLHEWKVPEGSVRTLRMVPGKEAFATTGDDGALRTYALSSPYDSTSIKISESPLYGLHLAKDGDSFAVSDTDGFAFFGSLKTGKAERLRVAHEALYSSEVSVDGALLLSWSASNVVRLLRRNNEDLIHEGQGRRPEWSPDGSHVAYLDDKVAVLLPMATLSPMRLNGHSAPINAAAFSPDNRKLITASEDRSIKVWDVRMGNLHSSLDLGWPVFGAEFSPDGKSLLAYSNLGKLRVWATAAWSLIADRGGHEMAIMSAHFAPGGRSFLSSSMDGTVRVWDLDHPPLEQSIPLPGRSVYGAAMRTDCSQVVTLHEDGNLNSIHPKEGLSWGVSTTSPEWGKRLSYVNHGKLVLAALDSFTSLVLDAESGSLVRSLPATESVIRSVTGDADTTMAATGEWSGRVTTWNVDSGEMVGTYPVFEAAVTALAYDAAGGQLAAGSANGKISIVDTESGATKSLVDIDEEVYDLQFLDDGRLLVGGDNGWAGVLARDENILSRLEAHVGPVMDIGVTLDQSRLVTAGTDGNVFIWHADTGDSLGVIRDGGLLRWAGLAESSNTLVTASQGSTAEHVRTWRIAGGWNEDDRNLSLDEVSRQFRASTREESGATPAATRRIHFTNKAQLGKGITALRGLLADTTGGEELIVLAGVPAAQLAGLGLRSGFALTAVEGIPIAERASVLESLSRKVSYPTQGPVLRVRDGAFDVDLSVQVIDQVVREIKLSMPRDEYLRQLDALRSYLAARIQGLGEINDRNWEALSGQSKFPVEERDGLWLNTPLGKEGRDFYLALGLSPSDKLTAVDGKPIRSDRDLAVAVRELRKKIQAADGDLVVEFIVEHGEFEQRRITCALS